MGINDREDEAKYNKRKRTKEARSRRASQAGTVDWTAFDWDVFKALAESLVSVGGAVRLGATRDGGAWAFGIYAGDDYATEYVRPSEDFAVALVEICEAWVSKPAADQMWERVLTLRAR